jgi:hypothetical protein
MPPGDIDAATATTEKKARAVNSTPAALPLRIKPTGRLRAAVAQRARSA